MFTLENIWGNWRIPTSQNACKHGFGFLSLPCLFSVSWYSTHVPHLYALLRSREEVANIRQCLTTFDNVWPCLRIFDNIWQCLTIFDNIWQYWGAPTSPPQTPFFCSLLETQQAFPLRALTFCISWPNSSELPAYVFPFLNSKLKTYSELPAYVFSIF